MSGSMREKKRGVWELRAYAGRDPVTGRERYRSRTFHGGKREAAGELAKFVTEVRAEKRPATEGTVAFLLERWLEHGTRLGRSPSTQKTRRSYIAGRIVPAIGDVELRHLTAAHLDRFYGQLIDEHLAAATIRQIHTIISGALNQARKWGWVAANVAQLATPPGPGQREIRPPTVDEVRRLVATAEEKDPTVAAMLFTAATTGARRGELCALRWCDVDLEPAEPTLVISHSIVDADGIIARKDTKTHQVRRLALDPATAAVLARQRARQDELAAAAGVAVAGDGYVFSQAVDASQPYRPNRVSGFFRRLRARHGLEHVNLHHLRHFMITQSLAAGVDVRNVAGRAGHSGGGAVTMRVYAHFLASPDRQAANHLGQLVAGARP